MGFPIVVGNDVVFPMGFFGIACGEPQNDGFFPSMSVCSMGFFGRVPLPQNDVILFLVISINAYYFY